MVGVATGVPLAAMLVLATLGCGAATDTDTFPCRAPAMGVNTNKHRRRIKHGIFATMGGFAALFFCAPAAGRSLTPMLAVKTKPPRKAANSWQETRLWAPS